MIGRHRPSISRGSALHVDAGGLLTPRSSALTRLPRPGGPSGDVGPRAPWSQWRGPCRTCTDLPVLHRRRECSRRSRSRAAGHRGRRRRPLGRCRSHATVQPRLRGARLLLPRTISHLIGDEPVRLGFRFGSASRRSDSRSLGAPLATTMSCHRGRETSGLLSGPARSARWALLRGRSGPAIRCRSLSRAAAPCRLRPLRSRWRALSRRAPAARQGRAAGGSPRA